MHDAPSLQGLTGAAARWAGHHSALAARLGQPGAVRLTEEQEALALGVARRLVHLLAAQLPLKTPIDSIWARWERAGLPSATLLAPAVFARVEEYRWRRMMTGPLHDPLPGLFAETAGKRRSHGVPAGIDAARAATVDAALLALRIVDGGRSDAFGLPLLLPAELPPLALRALLFDTGAQDLAQAADMNSRAPDIAAAVERVIAGFAECPVDAAAHSFVAALEQADLLTIASADAMARHDWLAVIAVVAAKAGLRFAEAAAALVAADEGAVLAFFTALGLDAGAVAPLLDSLAEIPGRPCAVEPPLPAPASEDLVRAVAARAEALRARQHEDRP
jgi:hypothetical protein